MVLTNEQFEHVRRLALRLTGIELHERHQELIARRCGRTKITDNALLDALLSAAETGDPAACRRLIGLVTTSYTGFFRNPWHFDIAAEQALWAIQRRGKARFWSAAAATGEEPYSLAMALIEVLRRDDPPVSILATDINAGTLEIARQGEYSESALNGVDTERRRRFFREPVSAGRWRIAAEARRLVEFRCLNLADSVWGVDGPLDVVFCRNVLMYLQAGHRESALRRVASLVRPGGLVILDPAEHPRPVEELFSQGKGGVYSPRALPAVMESL